VGADESDDTLSGELLQLDLAAQSFQNNDRPTSRVSGSSLDLAESDDLSNNNLMYDVKLLIGVGLPIQATLHRSSANG
jgi:hypothetical protein